MCTECQEFGAMRASWIDGSVEFSRSNRITKLEQFLSKPGEDVVQF